VGYAAGGRDGNHGESRQGRISGDRVTAAA